MTWMDAQQYMERFEAARLHRRNLTREELVMLAIADNVRTPGSCAACGADLSHRGTQARWCEECYAVSDQYVRLAATQRYRKGLTKMAHCSVCGKMYPARRGPHSRCVKCQREYQLAYDRKRCREYRRAKEVAA